MCVNNLIHIKLQPGKHRSLTNLFQTLTYMSHFHNRSIIHSAPMATHNVKLALRNLIKHKSHTLISIFALAASRDLSLVIRSFSILSVLIAISGLYGLSLFITRKCAREIGIRKIHGAGSRQIIIMLILGFLKRVGLAFLIAALLTSGY